MNPNPNPNPGTQLEPRTRALRRRLDAPRRKAVQRRAHAWRRRLAGSKPKSIESLFGQAPPATTVINPARDAKPLRSGRLRKEPRP